MTPWSKVHGNEPMRLGNSRLKIMKIFEIRQKTNFKNETEVASRVATGPAVP